MFKNLNEALVEVLKIDPNSKKARQYSGFSVNGDEITFSTKQGRELTYTAGVFKGDYEISKVKTQGMEKKKIDRTINGVKSSYWKQTYLDSQGGTFYSTDIDGTNFITREVAALDKNNADMMFNDAKYMENIVKGEVRRIDEIRKMEGENFKAEQARKKRPYTKMASKHYEPMLADNSSVIRSVQSSVSSTKEEIVNAQKLAQDSYDIAMSNLDIIADQIGAYYGFKSGGVLGINNELDLDEKNGIRTKQQINQIRKDLEDINKRAEIIKEIKEKREETLIKKQTQVAKSAKEYQKKNTKNLQKRAKAESKIAKNFEAGYNIYSEAQNLWRDAGDALVSLREGIGNTGTSTYKPIKSDYRALTQSEVDAIVKNSKEMGTKEYSGTIKKQQLYKTSSDFSISNIGKGKISAINDKNAKTAYFDFESIGDLGTENFMATQLSVRRKSGNNEDYIFQLDPKQKSYIEDIVRKVKEGDSIITDSEARTLKSLTGYSMNGDKVIAKHKSYKSDLVIDKNNTEFLDSVQRGIDALSSNASNLVKVGNRKATIRSAFNTMRQNGELAIGHNIETFDIPAAHTQGAITKDLKTLDTYNLAKTYLNLGHTNASGKRLFSYNLGDLADFYGIDRAELAKNTGLTQHTAEYDVALNEAVAKSIAKDIETMTSKKTKILKNGQTSTPKLFDTTNISFKKGQIGTARAGKLRMDLDSFKLDMDGNLISQENSGDLLFSKGHDYSFDGLFERTVDGITKKYARYTDVETGDQTWSFLKNDRGHIDEAANIFGGKFRDAGVEAVEDSILSMFKASTGKYNLTAFNSDRKTSKQFKRSSAINSAKGDLAGSGGFLAHIYEYLSDNAGDIMATNQAHGILMASLGRELGINQGNNFSVSKLKDMMFKNATTVGSMRANVEKFLDNNSGIFKNKKFANIAKAALRENFNFTEEEMKTGTGMSKFHGFAEWVYEQLSPDYVIDKMGTKTLGSFRDYLGGQSDYKKFNKIMDEQISKVRSHYMYDEKNISKLYDSVNNDVFRDILTGADTLKRMDNIGMNKSGNISGGLGVYKKGNNDVSAFGDGSLGSILANFSSQVSKMKGVGHRIALGPDGKSLRVGIHSADKAMDVIGENGDINWDQMSGYVDIGLGLNDKLSINGIEKMNYFMPDYKDGKITMSTAREFIADRVLGAMLNSKNLPKVLNGESIQGSLNWYRDNILDLASSGGTYKTAQTNSFRAEAEDSFKTGATPEQRAVRSSAASFSLLFDSIAKEAGMDLGTGYDYTENLANLTMYANALAAGPDVLKKMGLTKQENFEDLGGVLANKEARQKFKSIIQDFVKENPFSLEGNKQQGFLSGNLNYAGSRDITPMAFLNSGSARNTDQFYNYLNRLSGNKIVDDQNRQEGYNAGIMKNYLSKESGRKLAGKNYSQGDVFDQFVTGYTDDFEVNALKDKLASDNTINNSLKSQIMSALDSFNGSLREGGAFVSESTAKRLSAYRDSSKFYKMSDLKDFGALKSKLEKLDIGDTLQPKIEEIQKDASIFGLNFKAGDIVKEFTRTADGILMEYKTKENAKMGSKFITEHGNRQTISQIFDDAVFDWIATNSGNKGANILSERQPMKLSNTAEMLGGRLQYIMTSYINNQMGALSGNDAEKMDKIHKNIQTVLSQDPKMKGIFNKIFKEISTGYDTIAKNTSKGYMTEIDGELQELFKSGELEYFANRGYGGFTQSLGRTLFDQIGLDYNPNLVSGGAALSNIYNIDGVVGSLDPEDAYFESKYKIGTREKGAVRTQFNFLKHAMNDNLATKHLEDYMEEVFTPNTATAKQARAWAESYESAFKDTELLNYSDKTQPLVTRVHGDIGTDQILEIVEKDNGNLGDNQISISDLFSTVRGDFRKGMSQEEFATTTRGRIIEAMKQRGIDLSKGKAIIRLGDKGFTVGDGGKGQFHGEISDIAIPLGYFNGNRIVSTESDKVLGQFFKTWMDFDGSGKNINKSRERIKTAGTNLLNDMLSYQDKNSQVFGNLNSVRVGNSMPGKAHGLKSSFAGINGNFEDNSVFVNESDMRKLLSGGTLEDLQAMATGSFRGLDGWDYDSIKGLNKEDLLNKVIENVKAGNALTTLSHRFPSSSRDAMWFSNLKINDNLANGVMGIGHGLERSFNADFDGDTFYSYLPGGDLGKLMSTSEGRKQIDNIFSEMHQVKEINDMAAELLGSQYRYEMNADAKQRRENERLMNISDSDARKLSEQEQEARNSILRKEKQTFEQTTGSVGAIVDILSHRNFGHIGKFSTFATKVRNATRDIGMEKLQKTGDMSKFINANLISALFEVSEQDAISAKKIGQKFMNPDKTIDTSMVVAGLEKYQSLLYNTWDYKDMDLREGAEEKANKIIDMSTELGFLEKAENDSEVVLKGRQARNAVSKIQATMAKRKGVDKYDSSVIKELETLGIKGFIDVADEQRFAQNGSITRGGLRKVLTETQMEFGGVQGFVDAINSEASKFDTSTYNTGAKLAKKMESDRKNVYGSKVYDDSIKSLGGEDIVSNPNTNMEVLNVGTITANTLIANTSSVGGSGITSSSGGITGGQIISGSGISQKSSKDNDFYVSSTKFDPYNPNSWADAKNWLKNNYKKFGIEKLLSEKDILNPEVHTNATLDDATHKYKVDGKIVDAMTASQFVNYIDQNKIPKPKDPKIQAVEEVLSNLYKNGQVRMKFKDGDETFNDLESIYDTTGNSQFLNAAKTMRATNTGTLVHSIMEKFATTGFQVINEDFFNNITSLKSDGVNGDIKKHYEGLQRIGGVQDDIISTVADNISAYRALYSSLGLIDDNGKIKSTFLGAETSTVLSYGNGMNIAGTFDAAFRDYLIDFKNKGSLDSTAHQLQLSLLDDMFRATYVDKKTGALLNPNFNGDLDEQSGNYRYLDEYGNQVENADKARKIGVGDLAKLILQAGGNGTLVGGAFEFGDMTLAGKTHLINMGLLNSKIAKDYDLGGVSVGDVESNMIFSKYEDAVLSYDNLKAYKSFMKLQSSYANNFEGFHNRITENGDFAFSQTGHKNLADDQTEFTYSYFNPDTNKQLDMKVVRDKNGNIVSQDYVPTEKDWSGDKSLEKAREDLRTLKTNRDLAEMEKTLNEEEIARNRKRLKDEVLSDSERSKIESDNENLIEKNKAIKESLQRYDYGMMQIAEKGPKGMFSDILNGKDSIVANMNSFMASAKISGDENSSQIMSNIEALKVAGQKYSNAMSSITELQRQGVSSDHSIFAEYNSQADTLLSRIRTIRAEIERMVEIGVGQGTITEEQANAINLMAGSINDNYVQDEGSKLIQSSDLVKAQQDAYIEDQKRLGELNKQEASLRQRLEDPKLISEAREELKGKLQNLQNERERIQSERIYDSQSGIIKVAQKDSRGNFVTNQETGEIIYDNYALNRVAGSVNSKAGFEANVQAVQTSNQRQMVDFQRQQSGLGMFGKIKQSVKNAADYMIGMSVGYTIIGAIRGQISKVIQLTQQLDKTMTDLSIVTGKNREEVTQLMQSYNGLAKSIGLTTSEVSASANEWLRMGYQTNDVNTLVKNSAMLAKLGMIEMGQATQYLTSAIKGYGVAVEDSEKIVDMATSLDMKYAVSAGYILEAMARTATSAKLAKVEMADLQSMIAVIGETSQKDASVVGESLKTAFSRYGNVKAGVFAGNSDYTSLSDQYAYETQIAELGEDINVNDIEKVLKQVGVELRNGTEWNSYSDILKEVGLNFKKMSDYEKNAITTAMFGTRQRENGLILLENYNEVMEASKIANESAGTATAKYIKYQQSLEATTNRVTSAYEKMVLDIKGSEGIKDVLSIISTMLENIKVTLAAISGIIIAFNFQKILGLLTTLHTKGSALSLAMMGRGLLGKGQWAHLSRESVKSRYDTLMAKNPEFVEKQRERLQQRTIYKKEGRFYKIDKNAKWNHPTTWFQKDGKGYQDIVDKYSDGLPVSQKDKDAFVKTHKGDIKKAINESNKNIDKEAGKSYLSNVGTQQERRRAIKQVYNTNLEKYQSYLSEDITTSERRRAIGQLFKNGSEISEEEIARQVAKNRSKNINSRAANVSEEDIQKQILENRKIKSEELAKKGISESGISYNKINKELKDVDKTSEEYQNAYRDALEKEAKKLDTGKIQQEVEKIQQEAKEAGEKAKEEASKDSAKNIEETKKSMKSQPTSFKDAKEALIDDIAREKGISREEAKAEVKKMANDQRVDLVNQKQKAMDAEAEANAQKEAEAKENERLNKVASDKEKEVLAKKMDNLNTQDSELRQEAERQLHEAGQLKGKTQAEKTALINQRTHELYTKAITDRYVDENAKAISEEETIRRQTVKASTISTIRGGADMVVGSMVGSEMGKGFAEILGGDEATWQAIGSMIGLYAAPQLSSAIGTSIATKFNIGPVGGSLISAGVTAVAAIAISAFNWFKKQGEEQAKKIAEVVETAKERIDSYSNLDNKTKLERYDKLAKGVNQFGENISLTESEYEEFKQLGNELGKQFDNLVIGFDKEGNALLGNEQGSIGGLTDVITELIEVEKQRLYKSNTETIWGPGQGPIEKAFKELKKDLEKMSKDRKDNKINYSSSDADIAKYREEQYKGSIEQTISRAAGSALVASMSVAAVNMIAGAKLGGTAGSVLGIPGAIGLGAIGAIAGLLFGDAVGEAAYKSNPFSNGKSYSDSDQFSLEQEVRYQSLFKEYDRIIKKYEDKDTIGKNSNGYDVIYDEKSNSFSAKTKNTAMYDSEFKKEIENATNKFIDVQTETYKKAVKERITEFTKEFLPSILGQSETFGALSDTLQSFVNNIAQGVDPTQFSNAEDYQKAIMEMFVKPLSDHSKKATITEKDKDGNKITRKVNVHDYITNTLGDILDKESKGIEATIGEKIIKNNNMRVAAEGLYNTNSRAFEEAAKRLGYTETGDGTGWWKKEGSNSAVQLKDIKNEVYDEMIGNDKTSENIINEIIDNIANKDKNAKNNIEKLTIEEARHVVNNAYKYKGKDSTDIVDLVQSERLTNISTLKGRAVDFIKEETNIALDDFEKLIDSGKTLEEIEKELFGGNMPKDLEKYLQLLNGWANTLGISLEDAYNSAENLSSLNKYGFTTKTVQQITEENKTMREIQNAIAGGEVTAEQLTYLYSQDADYANLSGYELVDKIGKQSGYQINLQGSVGNVLANSDAFLEDVITQSNSNFILGSESIKNYKDLLDFEYYFGEAVRNSNSNNAKAIQDVIDNNEDAKNFLINKNITNAGSVFAISQEIANIKGLAETEFKKKVAENLEMLADGQIKSVNKAHKDYLKTLDDINKQLKDLGKNNALNKLQKELEALRIEYQKFDKELSLYDWGFDHLSKIDFLGRGTLLEDKLTSLTKKNEALAGAMDVVNSKTPTSAEEASALKEEYEALSSAYIDNQKAIIELQDKMGVLGVNMLSETIKNDFDVLNKQMNANSRYASIANLSTYTGGAAANFLDYNLAGTIEGKTEIDRKRSEFEKLLDMQEDFNNKSLEYNKQYLDLKAKQDKEDYERQKRDLAEQAINARMEFYKQYSAVLSEYDITREDLGITDDIVKQYYGNSLISEGEKKSHIAKNVMEAIDIIYDYENNKSQNSSPNKDTEDKDEPKTITTPIIEGTNARVDTPENVSNHITNTMKSGIDTANAQITGNPETFGINAPPLNDSQWAENVDSGLGLKMKEKYNLIIPALNKYIETTNEEGTKLVSPNLDGKGNRGWGAENENEDSLFTRMKKRINACITALNTYISSGSGVGKLEAPKLDKTTWEEFGISLGKYIYNGMDFAIREGLEKDLTELLDSYANRKNSTAGSDTGYGLVSGGKPSPISTSGIPVGATVYMNSPTSPRYGHVGIMGSDGNLWHWSGSRVLNQPLSHLASKGYTPYAWGWQGGTPLSSEQSSLIDDLLRKRDGQGCGKSNCQRWVGLTYAKALNMPYISSGGSAKAAGSKWGTNVISYSSGTDSHKGGLALVGDEGVFKKKNGIFSELVITPDGNITLVGNNGPEIIDLPKGSQVINNADTKKITSYANGTVSKKYKNTNFAYQGLVFADGKTYMTAYDTTGEQNSILEIVDKNNKHKVLYFDNKSHVGGIGYHKKSQTFFVSNGNSVNRYKKDTIDAAKNKGTLIPSSSFDLVGSVGQASYLTVSGDVLFVGKFSSNDDNPSDIDYAKISRYDINEYGGVSYQNKDYTTNGLNIQGVARHKYNDRYYYIFAKSHGRNNLSEIEIATFDKNINGYQTIHTIKNVPSMIEQIHVTDDGKLGAIFESDSLKYRDGNKKKTSNVMFYDLNKAINDGKLVSCANGTTGHQGGLALLGDEGLVNNKTGLFPELVILPNGDISLVGTNGPVIADLPKGTEVLNNSDTEDVIKSKGSLEIKNYALGTVGDYLFNQPKGTFDRVFDNIWDYLVGNEKKDRITTKDATKILADRFPVYITMDVKKENIKNKPTDEGNETRSYSSAIEENTKAIEDNTKETQHNTETKKEETKDDKKYESAIDKTKLENYKKEFNDILDTVTRQREEIQRTLTDEYYRNLHKIPILSELEKLRDQTTDLTTRASYNALISTYSTDEKGMDFRQLFNQEKKKNDEARKRLGEAIANGESVEVIQAWSDVFAQTQDNMEKALKSIEESLDNTVAAFTTFGDEAERIYNNTKDRLNTDYENGWLGEKTNSNYYNPLIEAADEYVSSTQKAYNGALQTAISEYVIQGKSIEEATLLAKNREDIKDLEKESKSAVRERTQIELDRTNDRVANYERANQKIEEQLGYNTNLSDSQFRDVYNDKTANIRRMISEDNRALKNIENMSPEDQKALIDRLNKNSKELIDAQSAYIDNILNNAKRLTDASVNERDKKLSVGGITTYDENGKSIFEKNIEDFKEEEEAIAQAIVDTRVNLTAEAKRMGITDEDEIEEYINNNEKMISLNEQHLDNLKKQSEEHRKIRDYTLEQLDNEKKLLDLAKENEWASKANIQNYYDAVDESLDAQIAAQKKYLESKNLSEEEYQQTKMAIAELEREKHNNALQRMQDTQAFYEKEYNAMTYMVNEYITALGDEKETISETYDEEIDKLQKVNNAKERSIKLTELQNNLENAQNEKKRVYRAGVGFVYEQNREAVKKAKDELEAFYRQDQIDNLTKAKEMETKILDERIEKWNKYLEAIEKVYKTAERNHNINILENLLGVEGWQGVFNELNADMSDFNINYEDGNKIYYGKWTGFLEKYTDLSEKIYNKLEESVGLLKDIKPFITSNTDPENKNASIDEVNAKYKQDDIQDYEDKNSVKSWKDRRWRNEIRDYSALFSTIEGRAIANKWGITQQDAKNMHDQKKMELISFVREYGYEKLFKILNNPEINDTDYSINELKDAIALATKNKVDLGELTHEEASTRLDYINNQEMAKKTQVIENLIDGAVDIASMIKGFADGSTIRLNGVDFTKEELEEIRAEKIWMNYRSGKYDQIGADGNVDHYKTLEYIAGLADDIDGAEDENDKGTFGTGLLGKFWDSLLEHTFGGTKIEELSQSIHALVEGQSKALDETNTTLFEVYKQSEGKVEYETTNAGGTQSSPNFNLYNYYIAKESNKLGQVMDASAQVKDITNKK